MDIERFCQIEKVCNIKKEGESCRRQDCLLREAVMSSSLQIGEAADIELSKLNRRLGESLRRELGIV